MIYKTFDPAVVEKTVVIYQLLPLSYGYYHDIPSQVMKWSKMAMKLVESLFMENERKLQIG